MRRQRGASGFPRQGWCRHRQAARHFEDKYCALADALACAIGAVDAALGLNHRSAANAADGHGRRRHGTTPPRPKCPTFARRACGTPGEYLTVERHLVVTNRAPDGGMERQYYRFPESEKRQILIGGDTQREEPRPRPSLINDRPRPPFRDRIRYFYVCKFTEFFDRYC
jgi:hypothetical protein